MLLAQLGRLSKPPPPPLTIDCTFRVKKTNHICRRKSTNNSRSETVAVFRLAACFLSKLDLGTPTSKINPL